jgi:hypothetical protein
MTDETEKTTRTCISCGEEISPTARRCKLCNAANGDVRWCKVCREPMPFKAKVCNACNSHRGLFRYLPTSHTTLGLLTGLFGVIATVFTAANYLLDRNSNTRFKVTSSDDVRIYLKVWNLGKKTSALSAYRLEFDKDLHLPTVPLRLSDDDKKKAMSVIEPGASVTLGLTIPKLEPLAPYTKEDVVKALADESGSEKAVTLEIDVEESDDPREAHLGNPRRLFHTRSDTFPVNRIAEFITGRIVDGH